MVYKNWKYDYNAQDKEPLSIIPDKELIRPVTFFKYYALSDYCVDALTNLYVYASHPYQLNDPFDCDKQLIQFLTPQSAFGLFGGNTDLAKRYIEQFSTDEEYIAECNNNFWSIMYRKLGILSLTTTNLDMQMWALYAQNTGFCLEFDTTFFPFQKNGPFLMHYCDELQPVLIDKPIDMHIPMLIQTNVKHRKWEYENEWRLLIQPPSGIDMETKDNRIIEEMFDKHHFVHDRKFHYPISALKSITLGHYFFREIMNSDNYRYVGNEMHLNYVGECNQTKVLDFLSSVIRFSNVTVNLLSKDYDNPLEKYSLIPIQIIRLNDYTYRVVEVEND